MTIETEFGVPGQFVLNAMTLYAGVFPNGWLFGVDIPVPELFSEVAFGPPFFVVADAAGRYAISFGGLPLPFGVTVYSVAVGFDANGAVTHVVPAAAYSV